MHTDTGAKKQIHFISPDKRFVFVCGILKRKQFIPLKVRLCLFALKGCQVALMIHVPSAVYVCACVNRCVYLRRGKGPHLTGTSEPRPAAQGRQR